MKRILWLLFFLFPVLDGVAQDTLSMVFVGDAMVHKAQLDQAKSGKAYDFSGYFTHIRHEISGAGIAVVNLETPLAGAPYTGYPCFSAPDVFASVLKEAGFDLFLLANNHCLDKRTPGLKRTLSVLDTLGVKYAGAYADSSSRMRLYPCLMIAKGFRIVLLNYTYGTNGFVVTPPAVVNYIDKEKMGADIEEARRMKPDLIVANLHWGVEYKLLPDREQKELAAWLFDKGVRIVMGSHPHVVQPMALQPDASGRDKNLVVYSLGNFVSNMSAPYTRGGGLVKVMLVKDCSGTRITSARYSLLFTQRTARPGGKVAYEVVPASAWYDCTAKDTIPGINKLRSYVKAVRDTLNKYNVGVEEYKIE